MSGFANSMRRAALTVAGAMALLFVAGCHDEKKVDVASNLQPDRMPTMKTENVSTLISDSGRIQYKIVSPLWTVYDEADTPYWSFPKGLYLQKYDRAFKVIATVAADSAKYFKDMKLWRLEGNVEMHKEPKDLFLSERLFWDQRYGRIYSDTFIHIENENHVLEGYEFVSNERLTSYTVKKPTGIFPVRNPKDETPESGAAVPSAPAHLPVAR